MPRVPQILPDPGAAGGLPGHDQLDPAGFAAQQTLGVRTAAAGLEKLGTELDAAAKAESIAKDELARLDIARAKAEMARQYAEGVDRLKNDPSISTDDYLERVNHLGDKITEGVSKTLGDPRRSWDRFQIVAQNVRTTQEIEARHWNRQRLINDVVAQTGLAGQQDRKDAVFAATPEEQEAAVTRFHARTINLVNRGFISGAAGNQQLLDFQKDVSRGRTVRDYERGDAAQQNAIVASLRNGEVAALDPADQLTLANQFEQRDAVRREKEHKALEAARKDAAGKADKQLTDLMAVGNVAEARGVLAYSRDVMDPNEYRLWQERIDKGPVRKTDPVIKDRLIPLVYNSENDPRAVDRTLREGYARGLVGEDDMKAWAAHLETRINRSVAEGTAADARKTAAQAREESRLLRETASVEHRLRELTRVEGPGSEFLNAEGQNTYNQMLEDLHRNSPLEGGSERPADWLRRKQPEIVGRIASASTTRLSSINQGLTYKVPGGTDNTEASVKIALDALNANRSKMKEADYLDQVRLLREKGNLLMQIKKWQPAPTGGTGGTAGAGTSSTPREPSLGRSRPNG